MPLYDVKCQKCEREFEHVCKISEIDNITCSCGGKCKTLITNNKRDWFPEGGFWHPNFDTEPVFVKTKKHFKELCKQYNMTSRAL